MKSISKDAAAFVEGVVKHLKRDDRSRGVAPEVESLLFKMSSHAKRERLAKVESTVKLSPQEALALSRLLSKIAGHDVSVTGVINPSLIGGIRITMADWVMDASLRSELTDMAKIVTI